MKLSTKQREDLESSLYFLPASGGSLRDEITEDDIASYFAWSDRGNKEFVNRRTPGAEAIRWGKTYRDLWITQTSADLGELIFIWEIAKENPDIPEKVIASIPGDYPGQILQQFRTWKRIYADNPNADPLEVLRSLIVANLPKRGIDASELHKTKEDNNGS